MAHPKADMSQVIDRFWAKVDIQGPDDCWNWKASVQGGTKEKPYGQFAYGGRKENGGVSQLAHRFAYLLKKGLIDCNTPVDIGKVLKRDFVVRHTCDNPLCCNPKHLRGGTQKKNIKDMIKKGKKATPPEGGWRNKLTSKLVLKIRGLYKRGWEIRRIQTLLFEKYHKDVSDVCVWSAVTGKSWKDVT